MGDDLTRQLAETEERLEHMAQTEEAPLEEIGRTSRGYTIFRQVNEVGANRYWSDEIGGGVIVWDTALVDAGSLRFALAAERPDELTRQLAEARARIAELEAELAEARGDVRTLQYDEASYRRMIDETYAAVGDHWFLDPPDGGDVKLHEGVKRIDDARIAAEARIAALEAERDEIRQAERERCAQVCDRFNNFVYVTGRQGQWQPGSPFDRGAKMAADDLAARIRALTDGATS